jgi:hypothetical protein
MALAQRQLQQETRVTGAETSTDKGHVLSEKEMEEIRSDIENMVTPTWMTSVRQTLGFLITASSKQINGVHWEPYIFLSRWFDYGEWTRLKALEGIDAEKS